MPLIFHEPRREHVAKPLVKNAAPADDRGMQVATNDMMHDDEPRSPRGKDLTVPSNLERLSVEEMTWLRDRLRTEIDRLDAEIDKRSDVRRAAEAMFKKPVG